MQKGKKYLSIFIVFLILSAIIFGLSKTGIFSYPASFVSSAFSPVQSRFLHFTIGIKSFDNRNLKEENLMLLSQMSDYQKLKEQNKSLLDQFQTSSPKSPSLLPADVIGAPSFIPGLSAPENLIINKGLKDNVKVGQAVIFKNNLIGKVEKVNQNISQVMLITNSNSSLTVVTGNEKNILGVLNGEGSGEMVLDNVLLSENLKNGDLVFTKGDVNLNLEGIPPDLIIGKIISVEKRPSALFQKAQIQGLIDITKLSTVFIVSGQ
ncbi:MAG: hypothetical protein A2152_01685 [Candidatus Levybacteria bacterium RBG_16_35_6]|nr:MAG: hypothetical protein A2152_01685 [Candidatus Levybacteria bacterium RBG_16_35_6]